MTSTPRSLAVEVLDRVTFGGAYSHIALSNALDDAELSPRDRRLGTELVYGALTRQRTLDEVLNLFVNRPLESLDRPVLLSLRLAAYQLVYLDRIPDHAVVDEAVELTKKKCGRGAAGFVNGVLRSMLRNRRRWNVWDDVDIDDDPRRHIGLRHSLPDWIVSRLIDEYGVETANRMAASFAARPPIFFRLLRPEVDELPDELMAVEGVPGALRADSLTDELRRLVDQSVLTIQDLGSQLVGHFCGASKAASILDACAGLGGKTLHLAQLAGPDAHVTAVDPQRSKLDHLASTASAAGFEDRISIVEAPIQEFPDDAGLFDLVVVDAPCTGLGVIRRHPETRWRRSEDDVIDRARLQNELLTTAAKLVRPGGVLVYSVCTFTSEEGPGVVESFLDTHRSFRRESPPPDTPLNWASFTDGVGDLKLNPLDHDSDAFYAARLRNHRD